MISKLRRYPIAAILGASCIALTIAIEVGPCWRQQNYWRPRQKGVS